MYVSDAYFMRKYSRKTTKPSRIPNKPLDNISPALQNRCSYGRIKQISVCRVEADTISAGCILPPRTPYKPKHCSIFRRCAPGGGERCERCRRQNKRAERVAAVGGQRRHTDAKAHAGHRNRMQRRAALVREQPAFSASPRRLFGYFLAEMRKYRPRQGPALSILQTDYPLGKRIANQ